MNWSQYKLLIAIPDKDKREYYELETVNEGWTKRQLERQINSLLYERLLMSNDKESVLAVARRERVPESPLEIIKDPMYLEFLGLERKDTYYEKDMETAIISHLADFLLEMGKGFSFVARQKRFLVEDDEYFIDLVFYNRLLRCFVLIDLKTGKLSHQDIGQMQMYVNYYTRELMNEGDNPPVGIVLCADKSDSLVEYTLPEDNVQIFAAKYLSHLPSKEELALELSAEYRALDEAGAD